MKIDVEGMEGEVLRSWDHSNRRPWIVVIEATYPLSREPTHEQWVAQVLDRGYREVHFDGLSRYFLHESENRRAQAFDLPPNIFDGFAVTDSHFSSVVLRGENERLKQNADDLRVQITESEAHLISLESELNASRTSADEARAAAEEANRQRDASRQEQIAATNALIDSEQQHRQTLDAMWRERLHAESERQRLAAERERDKHAWEERERHLLNKVDEAVAISTATQLNLTRAEQKEASIKNELAALEVEHAGTCREIESLRIATQQADALIRNASENQPGRWRKLGEAFGIMPPRPEIVALQEWKSSFVPQPPESAFHQPSYVEPAHTMSTSIFLPNRNPNLRADSLAELLSWHDTDFVRCAYVTVLGRQPDPSGEAYYIGRIRLGFSKMSVLMQLRRSEEGRNHDPGIAGFDRALRRHDLSNLPIVGRLFRKGAVDGGDSINERQLRMIANMVGVVGKLNEIERNLSADRTSRLENKLKLIHEQLNLLSSSQGISPRRINQAEGPCEDTWSHTLHQVLA